MMSEFFNYVEKTWITGQFRKMLSVFGKIRRTNSEVEGFHCNLMKRMARRRPNFWYFLNKLKSVGRAYNLELKQLSEGKPTRRFRKKEAKVVDRLITEAEDRLKDNRYSALSFLRVISNATETSFDRMVIFCADESEEPEKENIESIESEKEPVEVAIDFLEEETFFEEGPDYTLCACCETNKIMNYVKPCGHMFCISCGDAETCPLCACKINERIEITFDDRLNNYSQSFRF